MLSVALRVRLRRRLAVAALRLRVVDGEAALAHERLDARVAAAELAVALGRVYGVADREDVFAQSLGHLLIIRPAGLGESFKGVGRNHIRPEVAVVAGRVRVAR